MKVKVKHIFYVGAFIILTILGFYSLKDKETYIYLDEQSFEQSGEQKTDYIYVHIDGAINNPGVKKVEKGTRVFELIEMSGGALEDADASRLNLSGILKDEQKILVPYKITEEQNYTNGVLYNGTNKTNDNFSGLININYATKEELKKITGIGSSTAEKIINYRNEVGLFNSIEDIMNVSGIGEGKFNKFKDEITV